jgi:hypothetical protein
LLINFRRRPEGCNSIGSEPGAKNFATLFSSGTSEKAQPKTTE